MNLTALTWMVRDGTRAKKCDKHARYDDDYDEHDHDHDVICVGIDDDDDDVNIININTRQNADNDNDNVLSNRDNNNDNNNDITDRKGRDIPGAVNVAGRGAKECKMTVCAMEALVIIALRVGDGWRLFNMCVIL
jgi:hypothetical protein